VFYYYSITWLLFTITESTEAKRSNIAIFGKRIDLQVENLPWI